MKKFLFTLAALLTAGSVYAINVIVPDVDFTEDQIGKVYLLPISVELDNEYINGWDFTMTYPEGLTVGTVKSNTAVLNQLVPANEDGDEAMVTPLGEAKADHIVGAYGTAGYWDEDEDGVFESYGAVKLGPTGTFKMYEIRITPTAEFTGGEVTVTWLVSGGFDLRNGQTKVQQEGTTVATLTVPAAPQPEVTEKPVITWEANDEAQEVVITVTGAGELVLYNDDIEVARGESPLTYTVPYTDDPEGEEMGFSATAQEEGKEVSEYALATVEVPGKPAQPEVTEAPVVTYEVTDDAVIITATGDGEVILYVNDEAVENPYTIARPEAGEEDIIIFVYGTAQEEGKEIGTSEVQQIVVEAQEGGDVPPVDPHAEGYWLVTYDMNGNEIWTELTESNGVYNVILRCSYGVYGTFDYYGGETRPDIEYYIVVDGVRYGAAEDGTLTVLGEALQNPLYEGENNYVLAEGLGKVYNMGVAIDEMTGDMYVYAAVAGFTEIDEMNAGKAVAGVRYFNMAGQEMKEANGMTIVVTTYTDGTTSAAKVMK